MKHQHILKDDEELSKVSPNGAKDFQVSERREAKNIKEILAKSKVFLQTNDDKQMMRMTQVAGHVIKTVHIAIC